MINEQPATLAVSKAISEASARAAGTIEVVRQLSAGSRRPLAVHK